MTVKVNSGAGARMLDEVGVSAKFMACAEMTIDRAKAERIRQAALSLERHAARDLGRLLAAPSTDKQAT